MTGNIKCVFKSQKTTEFKFSGVLRLVFIHNLSFLGIKLSFHKKFGRKYENPCLKSQKIAEY